MTGGPKISEFFSDLRQLGSELTRRRVVHAVAAYAVVAWVAIQVANIAVPALFLPRETLTVLVFLALLGFPVVVALSWVFEFSTEGVRRTRASDPEERLPRTLRAAFAATVVLATAGLGWAGWEEWLSPRAQQLEASATAAAAGDSAAGGAARADLTPSDVAVLYFDDHSPGDSLTAVADALTEHVIHRLAQVEALNVVSRNGVRRYRENPPSVDSIARALGTGSLVEGSVQPAGDSLQVTVQLIDGETQKHLMSAVVRRPREEVFALQDSLAGKVAELLRRRLGQQVQLENWRSETTSAEAWRLLQRASRLRLDAEQLKMGGEPGVARELYAQADTLIADAQSLDPDWRAPEVERAQLVADRLPSPHSGAWTADHRRLARKGISYAAAALAEDSANAEALRLRGQLRFWLAQNLPDNERADTLVDRAERDLRAAIRRDPDAARAWYALSELVLLERNAPGKARYYARRAKQADAFLEIRAQTLHQFFYAAFEAQKYDEAARWCRRGQRQYPDRVRFLNCELLLRATEGALKPDVDRAWTLLEQILTHSKESNRARFRAYSVPKVAAVLARAGRGDSARAVLRRARRDSATAASYPFMAYRSAHAYTLLGEEEKAIDQLAVFLEAEPNSRSMVREATWVEPLRDHPRFKKLVGAP